MIYLVVFAISIVLFYYADKAKQKQIKALSAFLGILVPSILAGLRASSVGTDTEGYVYYFTHISGMTSLSQVFNDAYLNRVGIEFGFRTLDFIISRFTNNPHWMLGIIAFLTIAFIYLGAKNFGDKYPTWLIMAIFLHLHYCNDLNIARQGLATAIVFYGYGSIEKKETVKFIIISVAAFLIHSTAGIATPILWFMFRYLENKGFTVSRYFSIIVVFSVVLLLYRYPVMLVSSLLPRFTGYFDKYLSGVPFSFPAIIIRIPFLIVAIIYYHQARRVSPYYPIYFVFILFDLVLSQFGVMYGPFTRLTWFFSYYKLLMIGDIYNSYSMSENSNSRRNIPIIIVLIFIVLIVYWYIYTVLNKYGFALPVYPYVMDRF